MAQDELTRFIRLWKPQRAIPPKTPAAQGKLHVKGGYFLNQQKLFGRIDAAQQQTSYLLCMLGR